MPSSFLLIAIVLAVALFCVVYLLLELYFRTKFPVQLLPKRELFGVSCAIAVIVSTVVVLTVSDVHRVIITVTQSASVGPGPPPPPPQDTPREASRLFAGPDQYPPELFAAYGIVAFPSRPTTADRDRYLMLCQAYVAVLPHSSEFALPPSQQMVTVWPISSNKVAITLNQNPRNELCESAVGNYGLVTATQAMQDAARVDADVDGRGPFLLAWSPANQKGKSDALVLEANLSNVTTADEAQLRLLRWKKDILENPKIWQHGWNLDGVKIMMREWLDTYGPRILVLFGGKPND